MEGPSDEGNHAASTEGPTPPRRDPTRISTPFVLPPDPVAAPSSGGCPTRPMTAPDPAESPAPRILVTAGPTHEPIDAVRFVGNRSSGRMGIAIAAAAAAAGCRVTLLLGPIGGAEPFAEDSDSGVTVTRFRTTADLDSALERSWADHDVLVMAAAVADYRPVPRDDVDVATGKLRRTGAGMTIEMTATPDLLAKTAAASRPDQTLVGFALEPPERLESSARDKLVRKGVHAIVANPLETMDGTDIAGTIFHLDGVDRPNPPRLPKPAFAEWLVARVIALHAARSGAIGGAAGDQRSQ